MPDVAAGAGLLLLGALLYRPLLWPWGHPARLLTTDFSSDFYPWLNYSTRSLLSGRVPWWSPLAGCGVPFVAILENGVFFPGHLLLGLLVPGPSVSLFAAQVYQVLSLSLSGIGVYLLLRELGSGGLGAAVAGGLWAASRDLTYHLVYINYMDVLMCLPGLLLLTHRAVTRRSPWALSGAAVVLGVSLLAGNPQWTMMHVYALIVLYAVWQAPALRSAPLRRWPWLLVPLGLIVLAGTLVAAIQLIPSWELYRLSPRLGTGLSFASSDSLPLPFAWHRLRIDSPFGRGGLVFILAGVGLVLAHRLTAWAMAFIGLLAFVLVQGEHSLVYRLAYQLLPGFGLFRFPGRSFHLAVFALAVLAGLGVDHVWRRAGRPRPFAAAAVAGLTLLIAWADGGRWWTLAQGAGLCLGLLLGGRPRWGRVALVAVVGSAVLFPAYFPHRSPRWVAQTNQFYEAEPLVAWLKAQPGLYRISNPGALIHHAQARDYWAVHRWFFQGHYVTGIPSWTASSAQLHLRALDTFVAQTQYSRLYDLMNIRFLPQGMDPPPPTQGKYEPWDLQPGSRWQVDLAGLAALDGVVELGVTGGAVDVDVTRGGAVGRARGEEGPPQPLHLPAGHLLTLRVREGRARAVSLRVGGQEVLGAQPRWHLVQPGLWENRHALPRLFVVHAYEVHAGRDAVLRALRGVEPAATVLLEEEPRFAAPGSPPAEEGVRLVAYEPDRVEVDAQLTRPGFLVLTDTHYPGWRAGVGGVAVRNLRADYLFRAVALGPGTHRVVFHYQPRWRPLAWTLSALGLALAAAPILYHVVTRGPPVLRGTPRAAGRT